MPDGRIAGVDHSGRLSFFSGTTYEHLNSHGLGLSAVTRIHALSDSMLLVAGLRTSDGPDGDRLHIYNVLSDSIERSFFRPLAGASARIAAATAGWVHFDVLADTVAATFSVLDTIFLFTTQGHEVEKLPISGVNFLSLLTSLIH